MVRGDMLNKKKFAKAMLYLGAYYTNFKVNIENDYVLEVWYEPFKDMDDTVFSNLVKSYAKSEVYAPSSPTSLLQFFRATMKLGELGGHQAWELFLSGWRENGHDMTKTYGVLERHPLIVNTIKQLETRFHGITTDELKFVSRDFVSIYEKLVEQKASSLLTNTEKLLEYKEENER